MSGIFGLFDQDGAPVAAAQLRDMASLLARRGPDRSGIWQSGAVGLGHTLLATTSESQLERLPLEHAASGCVITGDIRLDNRGELLSRLGLADRATITGDGAIVLLAYLAWGESCVARLLGDFAFALWDPRSRTLTCARDQLGMRSLYYHHSPGRFFAFATEPRAVLVLPRVPYRLNEGRIADFLVDELEGIDNTSTFFEAVSRLEPAHVLTVTTAGMRLRRYWTLEPGTELRLASGRDYAEAFLEVFTEAVRCRLRSAGRPGSMLSGGLDSGTIAAVGRRVLAAERREPLLTVSAVSPLGEADGETRAIRAAQGLDGIEPHTVDYGRLDDLGADLSGFVHDLDEPFDGQMTLPRAVYSRAKRAGVNVVLDGAAADVVLTEGRYLARLLRAGRWRTAWAEATASNRYWSGLDPPLNSLLASARAAFVPDLALRRARVARRRLLAGAVTRRSLIDPEFARRIGLGERLELLERRVAVRPLAPGNVERAREIEEPHLTVGRERYDRVGAAIAVEPRCPYLDIRVAEFCARLPDAQLIDDGWPKVILRRAGAGELPDSVLWRRGREHLGWAFTQAHMESAGLAGPDELEPALETLTGYVDVAAARTIWNAYLADHGFSAEAVYSLVCLASWLRRHSDRPRVAGSAFS